MLTVACLALLALVLGLGAWIIAKDLIPDADKFGEVLSALAAVTGAADHGARADTPPRRGPHPQTPTPAPIQQPAGVGPHKEGRRGAHRDGPPHRNLGGHGEATQSYLDGRRFPGSGHRPEGTGRP